MLDFARAQRHVKTIPPSLRVVTDHPASRDDRFERRKETREGNVMWRGKATESVHLSSGNRDLRQRIGGPPISKVQYQHQDEPFSIRPARPKVWMGSSNCEERVPTEITNFQTNIRRSL